MSSIADNRKSRKGRPSTGIGAPVGLRLYPDIEKGLDTYIAKSGANIGRPEAIRRILTDYLKRRGMLG
jgi:hypothetical protein